MRVKDIITDELVNKHAISYSESARDHEADWKALKTVMVASAEIAASALGTPLEGSLMNDDGTWSAD